MEDPKENKNSPWLSVPQFGDWDQKGGNIPDYSMDFSKIREMRKLHKRDPSRASLGNEEELINPFHNSVDTHTTKPKIKTLHSDNNNDFSHHHPHSPSVMDPNEERRVMKEHKSYYEMLQYVADSLCGIPEKCACGKGIVCEVLPSYHYDFIPGKRFFICKEYIDNGLHYRQPWVCAVEEELERIKKRVDEQLEYQSRLHVLEFQNHQLKAEVEKLIGRVADLEVGRLTRRLSEL